MRNGKSIARGAVVIANLSGRGDKDVPQVAALEAPLIAFSYLNPVMRYGAANFARDAAAAGSDGVLLTDLPPEAADRTFSEAGLTATFLLAPTSSDKRIAAVDRASDGFVYYVST